jgi:beta-mannosidase
VHPNDPDHGTHHQWEVWNRIDYTAYRSEIPRFCSEFGFQAPPAWRTLIDWVHAADGGRLDAANDPKNDPNFLLHQKADDGNGKLDRGLAPHLGVPDSFADWHWATQLNQARAVGYAIDHYRRWWPRTAGAIVWQLNDCWPVTSWAAVDGDARRKPLWYALRRAYADRLITFHDGGVALVNDTAQPWTGDLDLTRLDVDGQPLAKDTVAVTVPARSALQVRLADTIASPADPTRELLVAQLDGSRALRMFAEDPVMAYPPAEFDATVEADDDGVTVTVTAVTLLRELAPFPDRLDPAATIDEQLVTLLPGETATFRITTTRPLPAEQLLACPVLRCVNEPQP